MLPCIEMPVCSLAMMWVLPRVLHVKGCSLPWEGGGGRMKSMPALARLPLHEASNTQLKQG